MKEGRKNNPGSSHLRIIFRAGTVAVSAGLVFYFLRTANLEEVKTAAKEARLWLALFGSISPLIIFWLTDCYFTVKSFEWFHRPVRFRDYLVIKAAAYLLNMVNIVFSTGGVFLYFMKKTGISTSRQAGILLFRVSAAVLGAVLFYDLLLAWLWYSESSLLASLRLEFMIPILAIANFAVALVVVGGKKGGMPVSSEEEGTLRRGWREFRSVLKEAGPGHWALGVALTLPPLLFNFLGFYLTALAFDIHAPLVSFMVFIPIASLISALPVAFGQLGTTTAAWALFFSAYGTRAELWACTLFIPSVRLLFRGLLGAVFLPFAERELESILNLNQ